MIDEFLRVAYEVETKKQAEYELVGMLEDLPIVELRKLASGTPIAELYAKTAYLDSAPCSPDGGGPTSFLDKFKDTPLFEQAMALEQEMLQAEAADIQKRMEDNAQPRPWEVMDQIRLKKRLLELQLAKSQSGAEAAPPGEPAQGAGAPGPVPAEGVQDNSQGLGGGVAKSASAQMVQHSDAFARALARSDFEKAARAEALLKVGSVAGEVLAKSAGIGSSIMGSLNGGALGRAAGWAIAHPSAAGSIAGGVAGAGAGAVAGGPGNRLGGAAMGAAGGAALGHAAGGIGARMSAMGGGMGVADAAKSYGAGVKRQVGSMLGPKPTAAAPNAGTVSTGGKLIPGEVMPHDPLAGPGAVHKPTGGALAAAPAGGGASVGGSLPKV